LTEHYVTLFDSVFLPQGLALHHSLLEHGGDCVLWVLCLDHACLQTLQRLDLPQMRLLDLSQLETSELRVVKPSRTRAEYCWTLTPWSIQWVFEADLSASRVTYVDADVFFLKNPAPVFDEFDASDCSVMLTEHGYAPDYDQTPTSGRYCVQFMPFTRDAGERVLYWWRDRCLEWCYARFENGLFGDQKYLESFESVFPGQVHVARSNRCFQAPWNASIHPFSDAILYHFHGLRIVSSRLLLLTRYVIPAPTLENVYRPYSRLLLGLPGQHGLHVSAQVSTPGRLHLLKWQLINVLRRKVLLQLPRISWYQCRPDGSDGTLL
jgi:hypothetical protein